MSKPRILIVDDERSIRTAIVHWFKLRGFEVDEAVNGQDALEKCEHAEYDVVTMDLEMPVMNGLDATKFIKEKWPDMPIVVLTGYLGQTDRAMELGVRKILTKPLRMRDLEDEVREILSSAES